ncbi:hypothetical protein NW855_05985 [Synechococcus sp. RC10B2]|jgi:hypothetical protein|uniref:hypothetical protein n=1 Tax=Synechococcus sp. RC10B2 TaxID=2964530 RepID=UPI0039C73C1A
MTIRSIVEEVLQTRHFTSEHESLIYRLLCNRCFDEADLKALAYLSDAMVQGIVQH